MERSQDTATAWCGSGPGVSGSFGGKIKVPPEIHQGFEVHRECQCLELGEDDTRKHSGSLALIEISQGVSSGRRTRACANHLQCYISGGWRILAEIEVLVA